MSQPCNRNCSIPQPGQLDPELGEFWAGSPWEIFQQHNLSCFERDRTFLNIEGQGFLDVSYISGADTDGDGRAVIAGDFTGDGQLDLLVRQVGGGPLLLYENQGPRRNYLQVSLRGMRSNRFGIGARLVAHVGKRRLVRELYPANTFRSQAPAIAHFGLDRAEMVDRLEIRWPSGLIQELSFLRANQHVLVTEGAATTQEVVAGKRRSGLE